MAIGRCSPASAAPWTCSARSTASRRARSRSSKIGFLGIAVALLGRNTAVGVGPRKVILFGALLTGTSQRNLDPSIFKPELASNLTAADPGPRRAVRRRRPASSSAIWRAQELKPAGAPRRPQAEPSRRMSTLATAPRPVGSACRRQRRSGVLGIVLGYHRLLGRAAADPAEAASAGRSSSGSWRSRPRIASITRGGGRDRLVGVAAAFIGHGLGIAAHSPAPAT